MKYFVLSTLILISISVFGCANGYTNLRSNPEGATIYVVKGNKQKTKVGMTPLNVPTKFLNPTGESQLEIRLEKEGYKPESYYVPHMLFSEYVDLSVQLQKEETLSCEQQVQNLEKVTRNVAQVMFLIQQKKFEKAESLLENLISENPDISTLHDLLGNVYYLNQKLSQALDSYTRSLELNQNSIETQRMVNKLKSLRMPSGESQ
ncbi:MAG: hypothetical protein KDD61_11620 [Bdellovibrionales bacterium]|nr:hypothetical protein [Bdellovibrionales bacterium]